MIICVLGMSLLVLIAVCVLAFWAGRISVRKEILELESSEKMVPLGEIRQRTQIELSRIRQDRSPAEPE